jgi:hypothetical protein
MANVDRPLVGFARDTTAPIIEVLKKNGGRMSIWLSPNVAGLMAGKLRSPHQQFLQQATQ